MTIVERQPPRLVAAPFGWWIVQYKSGRRWHSVAYCKSYVDAKEMALKHEGHGEKMRLTMAREATP